MKKRQYRIDPRANCGEMFVVEAESYGDAAHAGAKKIFNRKFLSVIRQTGGWCGSGMFQAYERIGEVLSSTGYMFHVTEI